MKKLSYLFSASLLSLAAMPIHSAHATPEYPYPEYQSSQQSRCQYGYIETRYLSSESSSQQWTRTSAKCDDEKTVQQRTSVIQNVTVIGKQAVSAVRGLRKAIGGTNTSALTQFGSGLSAGSAGSSGTGLWVNYDYTNTNDDNALNETDLHTIALGADRVVREGLAVGLAMTGQWIDLQNPGGNMDTSVYTVAPYMAMMLTDYLTLDATLGHSWVNDEPAAAASYDTSRWFGSANLTAFNDDPNWDISFNLGYLYTKDDIEAHGAVVQNDISFAQVHLGAEAGYRFGQYHPYINATFQQDLVYKANPGTYDPTGAQLGAGVRIAIQNNLTGELQTSTIVGLDNYSQYGFMGNLKYSF
ncbi:MAG: autotransporter outer membrane beta-barrel domain-containing protein [Magnetococcales bacterium]|nr:autotransporter outer membrane beta-barrel domain-containing protein [Magnetococcales bacterium]